MYLLKDYKVVKKILDYLGIYKFKRDKPLPRVLVEADIFNDYMFDDYIDTEYMDF
ncbi:MAG: hypothetical protein ISS13_01565 [Actinobacteria bacterium]|nr:hypothetical protein [Actinomycetota bacterium]